MNEPQYIIPKMDPKVFKRKRGVIVNKIQDIRNETPVMPVIKGTGRDINGGILIFYEGIPYPRKGFPDAEILEKLNLVKKSTSGILIGLPNKYNILEALAFGIKPWAWKIKSIDKFLSGYYRTTDYLLGDYYYEDGSLFFPENYYCQAAQAISKLVFYFLFFLGIDEVWAQNVGETVAMEIEHDDRYRMQVQDLFTESSKERLMNPRKEIPRLIKLFAEREPQTFIVQKFNAFNKLSFIFLHPKVKRAWKEALSRIDFKKLQFDTTDRYWALTWGNYNAMGRTFEDRHKEFLEIHKDLKTPYVRIKV